MYLIINFGLARNLIFFSRRDLYGVGILSVGLYGRSPSVLATELYAFNDVVNAVCFWLTSFANSSLRSEGTLTSFEGTLTSFEGTLTSFEGTLTSFEKGVDLGRAREVDFGLPQLISTQ